MQRDEIFINEIDCDRYLIYIPRLPLGFVGNSTLVNRMADLIEGVDVSDINPELSDFLLGLSLVCPDSDQRELSASSSLSVIVSTRTQNTDDSYPDLLGSIKDTFNTPGNIHDISSGNINQVIESAVSLANKIGLGEILIQADVLEVTDDSLKRFTEIQRYAESISSNAEVDIYTEVHVFQPAQETRLKELFSNDTISRFVLPKLPPHKNTGYLSSVESTSDAWHVWREMLLACDNEKLRYEVSIDVGPGDISDLSSSIRYLFNQHSVEKVWIDATFLNQPESNKPSSITTRLMDEFRRAKRVASVFGRTVSFVGAELSQKSNFAGLKTNTYKFDPDGQITAYSIPSNSKEHWRESLKHHQVVNVPGNSNWAFCSGCMARQSCLGPCQRSDGSYINEQEFFGFERCRVVREVIKDQVIERIAASGGLMWDGREDSDAKLVARA